MRIKWSNRIQIINDFLGRGDLHSAQQFAAKTIDDPVHVHMLLEGELEFLNAVIQASNINDCFGDNTHDYVDK